jgi:hypothetical protein
VGQAALSKSSRGLDHQTRLAALKPEVLAAMHGSTFKGSGEHALHELSKLFREVLVKSS